MNVEEFNIVWGCLRSFSICPTPQDQRGPGRCGADGGGTATGGESLGSSCNVADQWRMLSMVDIGLVSPGSLWLSWIVFVLSWFELNQMTSPTLP